MKWSHRKISNSAIVAGLLAIVMGLVLPGSPKAGQFMCKFDLAGKGPNVNTVLAVLLLFGVIFYIHKRFLTGISPESSRGSFLAGFYLAAALGFISVCLLMNLSKQVWTGVQNFSLNNLISEDLTPPPEELSREAIVEILGQGSFHTNANGTKTLIGLPQKRGSALDAKRGSHELITTNPTAVFPGNSQTNPVTFWDLGNTIPGPDAQTSKQLRGLNHIRVKRIPSFIGIFSSILLGFYIMGTGYAMTTVHATLTVHIISYTVGVAFAEELTKGLIGLLIYSLFLKKNAIIHANALVMALGIAGLGFGSGEAILYFSQYNLEGCGTINYLVRSAWCVPLHFSWAVIIATGLSAKLDTLEVFDRYIEPDIISELKHLAAILTSIIPAAFPAILLHGLYDAFSRHSNGLMWAVGIISLYWAFVCIKKQSNSAYAMSY